MEHRTPQALEALYATGHWLMSNDRYRDAIQVFQLMAYIAPSDERSWLALGTCHERLGQRGIALELYRVGTAVAYCPVRCRIALGRALRNLGHEDDARDAFDVAFDLANEADENGLATLAKIEKEAS